jgi:hypothetical protein
MSSDRISFGAMVTGPAAVKSRRRSHLPPCLFMSGSDHNRDLNAFTARILQLLVQEWLCQAYLPVEHRSKAHIPVCLLLLSDRLDGFRGDFRHRKKAEDVPLVIV